ncbi:Epidermal growth factor receptor substrate [Heracleum sosnowskyi]|uniref:Epidermal growth factor receptor substrate n=1 Tax=Heracleum sosnowskyi TaxID=360622 RepID=A0AAD8H9N7_9APIA|nr:Epidermal growth factor receptor substrate [Heracleum sosnowskyi]
MAGLDLFDAYFRRADLDQDGRISGAEAVSFFQASNLSKQVLAQIWMHADQNHTGFLGRAEFYNALKLVTVAQTLSAPQTNARPHANQISPSLPQTQNFGFRRPIPPTSGMSQQYSPYQANQSMRPPAPMPSGTAPRPLQGVAGPNYPGGGGITGPPVSTNLSSDWLGGQSGVSPTPTSSQLPSGGISPSIPSYGQKLPDPVSTPKTPASLGNGFPSNSMFGGDMFSGNQSAPKQASSAPTYAANTGPSSSAGAPVTSGPQPSAKLDPLESLNAFTRQSAGGMSTSQPGSKPNQQLPTQNNIAPGSSAMPVDTGNSASTQPQPSWPKMTRAGIQRYHKVFVEVDTDRDGRITGEQARNLFLSWRLPREVLKQVWDLSDQDNDSMLSLREFCVALYLMERYREGQLLPETLPNSVMLDETLLSLAGPPAASYGSTTWGSASGMRPQGPGPQPVNPAASRTPMQSGFSNQQNTGVPSMEKSQMSQQSNGLHNSADVKNSEESETENTIENKEKMLLDSREKMVFYREKMQDLVLFKSRCDNRLNEITERALADKREAELLGKKYEEKYKQVAEIASKLTIEEAAFREIQERKMEYNQAIIKMQQGGSADGILQVRADRLQSDLEELLKALAERCKRHGVQIKSAAVIELPKGWQPGIPEVSSVWDEEWDKFDDEGFSFDVLAPADVKSVSPHNEISSPNEVFSPDTLSNIDDKSEKLFNQGEDTTENESAYNHSGEMFMKSPTGSPTRQTEFESPSRDDSDGHFRKSFEADTETQRSFDEPTWGTFDNNDDTDSVWGFSSMNAKQDSDHEKHGEKSFFESSNFGGSPVRTGSPEASDLFPKKSPFGFEDSFPSSPLSRAGNSPSRFSEASGDQFFNNMSRFDSFAGDDHDTSSRRESYARFDSMSSTSGFDHSRGFSFDDSDPFGSSGPFKVSSGSETPKKGSDKWNAF